MVVAREAMAALAGPEVAAAAVPRMCEREGARAR